MQKKTVKHLKHKKHNKEVQNIILQNAKYSLEFLVDSFADEIFTPKTSRKDIENVFGFPLKKPESLLYLRISNKEFVYLMEKLAEANIIITADLFKVINSLECFVSSRGADSEQIVLLIEVSNYNEEIIKEVAFKLKDEYAKFAPKNCMIELWDDKKAYELYLERDKYIAESFDKLMEKFQKTRKPIGDEHEKLKKGWDKKNYVFIADHNPATISEGTNFWYYMLQDDYYKEMGGANLKKN